MYTASRLLCWGCCAEEYVHQDRARTAALGENAAPPLMQGEWTTGFCSWQVTWAPVRLTEPRLTNFHFYLSVRSPAYVCASCMCLVLTEARRGHWIPRGLELQVVSGVVRAF